MKDRLASWYDDRIMYVPHILLDPLPPTGGPAEDVSAAILAEAPNRAVISEVLKGVVEGQLSLYERTGAQSPWIGYLGRDSATGNLVGSCSFIGKPADGSVEIAYFTFPPYEGAGVATSMAAELLRIAAEAGAPHLHAFTLPEQNSSSRILQKLGFLKTGEAHDEDAGRVWRWEYGLT